MATIYNPENTTATSVNKAQVAKLIDRMSSGLIPFKISKEYLEDCFSLLRFSHSLLEELIRKQPKTKTMTTAQVHDNRLVSYGLGLYALAFGKLLEYEAISKDQTMEVNLDSDDITNLGGKAQMMKEFINYCGTKYEAENARSKAQNGGGYKPPSKGNPNASKFGSQLYKKAKKALNAYKVTGQYPKSLFDPTNQTQAGKSYAYTLAQHVYFKIRHGVWEDEVIKGLAEIEELHLAMVEGVQQCLMKKNGGTPAKKVNPRDKVSPRTNHLPPVFSAPIFLYLLSNGDEDVAMAMVEMCSTLHELTVASTKVAIYEDMLKMTNPENKALLDLIVRPNAEVGIRSPILVSTKSGVINKIADVAGSQTFRCLMPEGAQAIVWLADMVETDTAGGAVFTPTQARMDSKKKVYYSAEKSLMYALMARSVHTFFGLVPGNFWASINNVIVNTLPPPLIGVYDRNGPIMAHIQFLMRNLPLSYESVKASKDAVRKPRVNPVLSMIDYKQQSDWLLRDGMTDGETDTVDECDYYSVEGDITLAERVRITRTREMTLVLNKRPDKNVGIIEYLKTLDDANADVSIINGNETIEISKQAIKNEYNRTQSDWFWNCITDLEPEKIPEIGSEEHPSGGNFAEETEEFSLDEEAKKFLEEEEEEEEEGEQENEDGEQATAPPAAPAAPKVDEEDEDEA